MLNIPGLKAGFISYNKERQLLQSIGFGFWNSIVLSDKKNIKIDEAFCNQSNQFSFEKNQPLVFQHIDEKDPDQNLLIKKIAELGFKSYLAMPLFYNDEFIGILEAGSGATQCTQYNNRLQIAGSNIALYNCNETFTG